MRLTAKGGRRQTAQKEICRTANLPWMSSVKSEAKSKWYSKGRWALVLALIGILIVSFVAATQGAYGAWLLWIAVPLLMISLAYFYVVNALAYVWGIGAPRQRKTEQEEEHSEE